MSTFERISEPEADDRSEWADGVGRSSAGATPRRSSELDERRARMRRANARRRRRAQIRRRRLVVLVLVGALAFGMWNGVSAISSSPGRAAPRHLAAVVWRALPGRATTVPGRLAAFTWPDKGEAAVGIQGAGVIAHSPRERIVPIASMTKMMTAILILKDHPLLPGESGPSITLTAADERAWVTDSQNGDSVVPVQAGERLSEFRLLEALLMSSGDNIADILAVWDAHSIGAFVNKMNHGARALRLTHTVYADPSGVSALSRSTPSEQVLVAGALMRDPVARLIVAQKSIAFPVAGTIPNFNPALGVDGIIGVKSGFTHAAMGCLAVAAMRTVDGRKVMMIAVSTGNLYGLYGAAQVDEQLMAQAQTDLVTVTPLRRHAVVAKVDLSGSTTASPLYLTKAPPTFVAWRGARLLSTVLVNPLATPDARGEVARLVYSTPTGTLASVPLSDLPGTPNLPGSGAS